jgi:hypothetical protein
MGQILNDTKKFFISILDVLFVPVWAIVAFVFLIIGIHRNAAVSDKLWERETKRLLKDQEKESLMDGK